jgi:hypothetical protein
LDLSGSGYGPVTDFCEHGYDTSDSVKGEEFINQLSDHQLLEKDCFTELVLDASNSAYEPVTDSCERGNKFSDSLKHEEFLHQLSDHQLMKNDSVPWSRVVFKYEGVDLCTLIKEEQVGFQCDIWAICITVVACCMRIARTVVHCCHIFT